MNGLRIAGRLRGRPLNGSAEAQSLADAAGSLPAADVLEVLGVIEGRRGDQAQHHLRCTLLGTLVENSGDRALFLPLVRRLKAADPVLRNTLTSVLPKVNDPAEHMELCALLRQPEPSLRNAAAQILAKVGGKTALSELSRMMALSGFVGRSTAIDVVVRIAGHHAIPTLVSALPVASDTEKRKIIRYLGEERFMAGNRDAALEALSGLLEDDDEALVIGIVKSFSALATVDEWFDHVATCLDSSRLAVVKTAIQGLSRFDDPRVIALLRGKLRMSPKVVRLAILDTLEAIGSDAVLPPVVDALEDRLLDVRTRAADLLAQLGTSGKVDTARTILWLLRSRDATVRRLAVDVARKTSDPTDRLWPRLFEMIRDEDWWVRERVADALVELAGQRLLPHFANLLNDPRGPVRLTAVDVLRRLKSPKGLGALVQAASDDADWWVRERAVQAIAEMGDPRAGPYLVRIALREPEMQLAALEALGALRAPDTAPVIARLLASKDPDVRAGTLRCLELLDDRSVADHVAPMAIDPDPEVRSLAIRLMQLWELRGSHMGLDTEDLSALDRYLSAVSQRGFDDLLLAPGSPATAKRMGRVEPLDDRLLEAHQVEAMLAPVLSAHQLAELAARRDVDFSYDLEARQLRFRVNVFHQLHGVAAVFRLIRGKLPSLDELGLPDVVHRLDKLKNGLVLVGGPTGSGKSTTLAALVDAINRNSARHVITLEDPIEVVHPRVRSLINQREIGTHTPSYATALRATLRQDPDVLLVGEMRDLPTISFAVSAAETGHLVFGTVHTVSADTTLDRLINVFPSTQQDQVRSMLASSLRAVICQYLLPRADGEGRTLACEVMLNNDAVANLIRNGKCYQLPSVIATSREQGMQLMDNELLGLYEAGRIEAETAYMKARSKKEFETLIERSGKGSVAEIGQ